MSEIKIDDSLLSNLDKIKVIYTDVDNTIVNDGCLFKSKRGYAYENAGAIFEMLNADIDVVMVSGRDKNKLFETARLLGFKNYIGNLGMQIVYNLGERIIKNYGTEIERPEELKEWIVSTRVADRILSEYKGRIRYYKPWSDILTTHLIFIGELEIKGLVKWIENEFPLLRIIDNGPVPPEEDFKNPHAYHIVPAGVGKRSAVAIDRRERELRKENLIAIGDSFEDLTIAEEVGIYFNVGDIPATDLQNVVTIENSNGLAFSKVVNLLKNNELV